MEKLSYHLQTPPIEDDHENSDQIFEISTQAYSEYDDPSLEISDSSLNSSMLDEIEIGNQNDGA